MNLLNELQLGEPVQVGNVAIVPILRNVSEARDYVTLKEAKAEVKDTGNISRIAIRNLDTTPIFVRSGSIFEGIGTQSRGIIVSVVVAPGEEVVAEARCVHRSHPIYRESTFKYAGSAPIEVSLSLRGWKRRISGDVAVKIQETLEMLRNSRRNIEEIAFRLRVRELVAVAEHISESIRMLERLAFGDAFGDGQMEVWDAVQKFSSKVNAETDNLVEAVKMLDRDVKRLALEITSHNTVGVALVKGDGCIFMEFFDHPDSWKAMAESVLKEVVAELDDGSIPDSFNMNVIRDVLRGLEKGRRNVVWSANDFKTEVIESERYISEITWIGNKIVHAIVARV